MCAQALPAHTRPTLTPSSSATRSRHAAAWQLLARELLNPPAPFVFFPAASETTSREAVQAFVPMRIGIVGFARNRLAIARERLVQAPEFAQRIATIVERLAAIGFDRQRPAVA